MPELEEKKRLRRRASHFKDHTSLPCSVCCLFELVEKWCTSAMETGGYAKDLSLLRCGPLTVPLSEKSQVKWIEIYSDLLSQTR